MRINRTAFVVLGLLTSGAAFAGAPGWSVSETSGQVSVVSTGVVKVATRGGPIAIGDVINTGRNGRAVLVRGEEYLVVSPNSRISVADPVKSGGLTQIVEQFGNVIYKIKKMTMPHFAVETPFLAAVVKGTTFSVTVTDKGASVQVIEGRVEVATRDGGASFLVLPGDIGSVNATAPGRLSVQGRENRSIDSPTPAAAAAAVTASVEASDGVTAYGFNGIIETAVSEGPVPLDTLSGGMVRGDSTLVAMVASAPQTASALTTVAAAEPTQTANVVTPPTSSVVVAAPIAVVAETPPATLPPVAVAAAAPPTLPAPVIVAALPSPSPPAVVVAAAAPVVSALPPVVVAAAAPVAPTLPPVVVAALPSPPLPPVIVAVLQPTQPPAVVFTPPNAVVPNNPILTNPGNGNGKGNKGPGNGKNDDSGGGKGKGKDD